MRLASVVSQGVIWELCCSHVFPLADLLTMRRKKFLVLSFWERPEVAFLPLNLS